MRGIRNWTRVSDNLEDRERTKLIRKRERKSFEKEK
jgi:hypothetical protein